MTKELLERGKEIERWRDDMKPRLTRMVPFHLQDGLIHHCLHGRMTGSFLTAVMENDLLEAVCRGDQESIAGLKDIVQFLYNYSPPGCWGSPAKVKEWRAQQGLWRVEQ